MYEDHSEDATQEIEIEAIGIEINTQPIELFKVFKLANLVGSGGEAKHIISEGYVAVNGEIETRKRRKLYDGDLVEFNQEFYLIICHQAEQIDVEYVDEKPSRPAEVVNVEQSSGELTGTDDVSEKKQSPSGKNNKSNKGRKSISFL